MIENRRENQPHTAFHRPLYQRCGTGIHTGKTACGFSRPSDCCSSRCAPSLPMFCHATWCRQSPPHRRYACIAFDLRIHNARAISFWLGLRITHCHFLLSSSAQIVTLCLRFLASHSAGTRPDAVIPPVHRPSGASRKNFHHTLFQRPASVRHSRTPALMHAPQPRSRPRCVGQARAADQDGTRSNIGRR